MRTFKNLQALEKRLQRGIAWDDYFMLGGRLYEIYEYGPGPGVNIGYDYVYFLNKRSGNLIYIKYICPSYQFINGVRQQTKSYQFIDLELQENAYLWR